MEPTPELSLLPSLGPLVGLVFIIGVGVVLMYQQFQHHLVKQTMAREAMAHAHRLELLRSSLEVQERERERIAQDLHDELGSLLALIHLQMEQFSDPDAPPPPDSTPPLAPLLGLVAQAIQSTERISHQLMPAALKVLGLPAALQSHAQHASATGNTDFAVHLSGDFGDLHWPAVVGLYRIYAELVHNTLKHAEATQAVLHLERTQEAVSLRYADNGHAFSPKVSGHGRGLKGIEGRVVALGGNVAFGQSDSGGFALTINWPDAGTLRQAEPEAATPTNHSTTS